MGKTTEYPVKSLISFDALENPSWHTPTKYERQPKTVTEMITQIKEYHTRWEQARVENTYNEDLVKKVSVFNTKYGHFALIAPFLPSSPQPKVTVQRCVRLCSFRHQC